MSVKFLIDMDWALRFESVFSIKLKCIGCVLLTTWFLGEILVHCKVWGRF